MRPLGRVLCLCEGGNVRSVALAAELKAIGQDAMAAGLKRNSISTLSWMLVWANTVVLMSEGIRWRWDEFAAIVPKHFLEKVTVIVVEVGRDRYGRANHPELKAIVKARVAQWSKDGWMVE